MRQHCIRFHKLYFGLFLLGLPLLLAGCTTAWTGEASNIIRLLVPAIESALAIMAAFGVGLAPNVLQSVQSWAQQATADLTQVASLIDQYNAAEATAKPGILTEIQTMLSTITANLQTLLPSIHVTDASTQAKITAIINLISGEMTALIGLVPAISGKVTSHDELKALMAAVKSPKEFRSEFNSQAEFFGSQYTI
jgi:hypothetical protein